MCNRSFIEPSPPPTYIHTHIAIYELFDHLILIADGRTIYSGPVSHEAASAYFGKHGFVCPPLYNEIDYFLDVISTVSS